MNKTLKPKSKPGARKPQNTQSREEFPRASPPGVYHCACGEVLSGEPKFYTCPNRRR